MRYRGRYAYEHVVVWWKHHGCVPPKGYEIHHKDMDHRNNRVGNLELLTSGEHKKLHGSFSHRQARKKITCGFCEKIFYLRGNRARSRLKDRKFGKLFCSRSCGAKHQFSSAG
jgi:hypothetical protein